MRRSKFEMSGHIRAGESLEGNDDLSWSDVLRQGSRNGCADGITCGRQLIEAAATKNGRVSPGCGCPGKPQHFDFCYHADTEARKVKREAAHRRQRGRAGRKWK